METEQEQIIQQIYDYTVKRLMSCTDIGRHI